MDKVYLERPNVCEVLRTKIKAYKREHPRLNSSQIARKFGIATSTFNRIENKDIRNPSIEQAVKVLRGTGGNEEVAGFIRTYYPDIHEGLLEYFVESTKDSQLEDSVEKYFCDEATYKMMMLATTKLGLSESYVLQEFGRSGHKTFMKLASKGILVNRNNRFFASDKDIYLDSSTSSKVASLEFDMIAKKQMVGEDFKGSSMLWYESVDFQKIKSDLKALTEDYDNSVRKLLKDPRNTGQDLVTVTSLASISGMGGL